MINHAKQRMNSYKKVVKTNPPKLKLYFCSFKIYVKKCINKFSFSLILHKMTHRKDFDSSTITTSWTVMIISKKIFDLKNCNDKKSSNKSIQVIMYITNCFFHCYYILFINTEAVFFKWIEYFLKRRNRDRAWYLVNFINPINIVQFFSI